MKLLHTSDWHLGHQLYRFDRTEEQTDFLRQLVELVDCEKPDVLLVSGDVYHTSQPSAAVQTLFAQTMVRLHAVHPGLTTVVTAGNHDSGSRHEVFRLPWEALRVYAIGQLDKLNLDRHIVEIPDVGFVVALPYVHRSYLPDGFIQLLLDRVAERNPQQLPVVLSAHLTLQGSDFTGHNGIGSKEPHPGDQENPDSIDCPESAIDCPEAPIDRQEKPEESPKSAIDCPEAPVIGGIEAYTLDQLGEGYDYLALGHIHRPQFVHSGRHNVRYSGAPLAVTFDEAYAHSVSLVEIGVHGEAPRVREVPVANLHPLVTLPVRGTATWEEAQQLLKDFPPNEPAYLRVKVEVTDFLPPEAPAEAELLCRDKEARFCLLQPVRRAQAKDKRSALSIEEFRQERPVDLARRFAEDTGCAFDAELEALFNEVVREVSPEAAGPHSLLSNP